jgi:hypothetical protein
VADILQYLVCIRDIQIGRGLLLLKLVLTRDMGRDGRGIFLLYGGSHYLLTDIVFGVYCCGMVERSKTTVQVPTETDGGRLLGRGR